MNRQTDDGNDNKVYFRSDRIFFQADLEGRGSGWYIAMRGGHSYGPFPNRDVAEMIVEGLIKRLQDKAAVDEQQQDQKKA